MTPQRIQRQRTKGWKMPANTVYVGRPSKFGNPYSLQDYSLDVSLRLFEETATGGWDPSILQYASDWFVQHAYIHHTQWLKRIGNKPVETIIHQLRGKNLACWCPLGGRCHADVLLKLANSGTANGMYPADGASPEANGK